jgi:hypothetical protein
VRLREPIEPSHHAIGADPCDEAVDFLIARRRLRFVVKRGKLKQTRSSFTRSSGEAAAMVET